MPAMAGAKALWAICFQVCDVLAIGKSLKDVMSVTLTLVPSPEVRLPFELIQRKFKGK